MDLIFQLVLLVVGLILLWKMGDLCVRHALGFSSIYNIHQFTVGFFIFAISTGFPEISSALVSSLSQVPELSVGNLMGATLVNITWILGVVVIIARKIDVSTTLKRKIYLTVTLVVLILLAFLFLKTGTLWLGICLIVLYVGSIFWFGGGLPKTETVEEIKKIEKEEEKIEKKALISPKVDIVIKLLGSLTLLLLSSWVMVHAATKIAKLTGINLNILGGTLVAIGTSCPELALEIQAIRKKEYALALGDLFGSSFLNISLIMGFLLVMNSELSLKYVIQVLPFIGATILWVVQALWRKQSFHLKDGLLFIALFICYLIWTVFSSL